MKKYWMICILQLTLISYTMKKEDVSSLKRNNPYEEAAFFKISSKEKHHTIVCLGGVDYKQLSVEKALFKNLSGQGHQVITYYDKKGKKVGPGEIFLDSKNTKEVKEKAYSRLNGEKAIVAQACLDVTKVPHYITFYDKKGNELARMIFPDGSRFNKTSIAEAFNLDMNSIDSYTIGPPKNYEDNYSTKFEGSSESSLATFVEDSSEILQDSSLATFFSSTNFSSEERADKINIKLCCILY